MTKSTFNPRYLSKGDQILKNGGVKTIVFSEGTYQVEVYDPDLKITFWPFLQLGDEGDLKDFFCTCEEAEKETICTHLSAAFLKLSNGGPLHIRFRASLWNQLCLMSFKRHGSEPTVLKKQNENQYVCTASKGEVIFSLKVKTPNGEKIINEMIFNREVETEETSLKFSNLSLDELALWNRGTPSQAFQYELSFWSDLAKWMMLIQEFNKNYTIDFSVSKQALPKKITLIFQDIECYFYIAEVNWKDIIPSLKEVKSPLSVHEFCDVMIKKIIYDSANRLMRIISEPFKEKKVGKAVKVGEWDYYHDKGFFPAKTNPVFKKKTIPEKEIGTFLSHNFHTIKQYLTGTTLSKELITPSYQLHFDQKQYLHISYFMFQPGDLQTDQAVLLKPWVFIENRGFYRIKETLFNEVETVVPPEKIGDFINEYRQWLNEHEGFQIHLSNVEFQLSYEFDLKTLIFESESQKFEGMDEIFDFGNWLYIKGKGFYKKISTRGLGKITSSTRIQVKNIPFFIHENKEELEQIKNFFSPICPIEKVGINISMDNNQKIIVEPEYTYRREYQGKKVYFFGDFIFVKGEGFTELPVHARLPEKYREKQVIDDAMESTFINVELVKLKSFIIKIDRRLKRPHNLILKVNSIKKNENKTWDIDLIYASEFGKVDFLEVKKSIEKQRSYAITEAGLLFFKDSRFNWIRGITDNQEEVLSLSTLEWMRLRTLEKIEPVSGESNEAEHTRLLLKELDAFETEDTLVLDDLKSTLRPYQEKGVQWLWFLYSYGLSGLLCDDMGLGKSHQAMALLAAVRQANKGKKVRYFIVCPTSVIYHWEELLKNFLPIFKVVVFYGTQRTLKSFNSQADVLLTSYGTLRSEKEALSKINFEIAIIDEIQIAKNSQSQTHHSLTTLNARTKIGLTGTPIENRLLELKALFDIVLPGYLPSFAQYREMFIHPIEKLQDQEKKILLSQLIHPFLMRRKKSEVLEDLPEKIEEIAYCYLSEEQQKLYRETFLQSRDGLIKNIDNSDKKVSYVHIFALLNRLKQICNHPCLITKDLKNYKEHQSGKWDLFIELLNETRDSRQKLVIFSQYLDMMTIIEYYLKEKGIKYASIRGSTQDRKTQLQKFRDDPECEVFIASLKAAGTGIDLTAASVVIHYDRWWNPAKENQATDRVHRIGQNRGVQVFKMVTRGTIEGYIHEIIQKKVGLFESVIGYDDQDQIKNLNREDLLNLIEKLNCEFKD